MKARLLLEGVLIQGRSAAREPGPGEAGSLEICPEAINLERQPVIDAVVPIDLSDKLTLEAIPGSFQAGVEGCVDRGAGPLHPSDRGHVAAPQKGSGHV